MNVILFYSAAITAIIMTLTLLMSFLIILSLMNSMHLFTLILIITIITIIFNNRVQIRNLLLNTK